MKKKKLTEEKIELIVNQIEAAWKHFQSLRDEAKAMLSPGSMPDAELQLNDVLKTTEDATVRILQQATEISTLMAENGVSEALQQQVQERVNEIYAACSFQDLTGQQIKKVLGHINSIGQQLKRLSDLAHFRGEPVLHAAVNGKDPLLNGPQLSHEAPSQDDIDSMFKNA